MQLPPTKPPQDKKPPSPKRAKQERLAEALRQNLQRRKAAAPPKKQG